VLTWCVNLRARRCSEWRKHGRCLDRNECQPILPGKRTGRSSFFQHDAQQYNQP
jgi:hypothetical protein